MCTTTRHVCHSTCIHALWDMTFIIQMSSAMVYHIVVHLPGHQAALPWPQSLQSNQQYRLQITLLYHWLTVLFLSHQTLKLEGVNLWYTQTIKPQHAICVKIEMFPKRRICSTKQCIKEKESTKVVLVYMHILYTLLLMRN